MNWGMIGEGHSGAHSVSHTSEECMTHLSHDSLPQRMFVQGHVHLFTQVTQGAIEVSGTSEVDQSTCILLIWHHNDIQSPVLQNWRNYQHCVNYTLCTEIIK